jgi:multiple sugar transport system permease protein
MIIPIQLVMNFTAMIPFALTMYVGMTNWQPQLTPFFWEATFVGPQNFFKILGDDLFIASIARTLLIIGVCVPIEFLLGFGQAYVLSGNFRGRQVIRVIAIVPMMMVPIVTGYVFYLMFIPTGPVSSIINFITGNTQPIQFLANPNLALLCIMLADIWQWTPFMFLIFVSSILALPQEPINASYVLGASRGYTFRRVMLPMLRTPILIALLLRTIECFKIFDVPYIMTQGGPGYSTYTISMHLYESAFKYLKYGFTNSESLVIFIIMIFVGWYASKPLRGV